MRVIPAVDVLDHEVVQLVGGIPGSQQVRLPGILETAMSWVDRGAPYLHLVDLDGAFGKEPNVDAFKEVIRTAGVPCEVGGGIRSEERIAEYIKAGADRVVVGTKAVKEPEWLADMARRFPQKIVLGLDTKGGRITVKGWQESAEITVEEMFDRIRTLPVAAVLNTNVDVEGQGKGIDADVAERFIAGCPQPVVSSGGVSSVGDLEILSKAGAEGTVVGMAIYKGTIEPWNWETPWYVR